MPLHPCDNCKRLSPLKPYCGKCKYGRKQLGRRPDKAHRVIRRLDLDPPPPVEYSLEYRHWVRDILEDIASERRYKVNNAEA